ncbi:MAG TPA: GTP cyclohydrolase II [Anaeromyxobacteraceae bacterium]|nr:GTP cyclohydrolase II [Anaeromyxobacteraceae bacterium]
MTVATDALRDLVVRDREHECEGYGDAKVCVRIVAVARLPTRFGDFRLVGFWNNRDGKEHVAMVHGDVVGAEDVAVRLHSECLTGDVMGSLRCDCRDQLAEGLRAIQREGRGVLLYLRQEGRGIGLLNKIRAYALQEQGLDTVEANQALGFRDDERDYAVAAHMVKSLGLRSVRVITNNPDKMAQLTRHGVVVTGRIPHVIPPNEHNRFYLETKAARSGHLIDIVRERLPEQSDAVIVDGMPPR